MYRLALDKRTRISNLAIPEEIRTARDIARYLDDLYHEAVRPGQSVSDRRSRASKIHRMRELDSQHHRSPLALFGRRT
ncbi:MAG: DUF7661 family protein [Steroidobacteraceae bacterium]